MGLGKEGLTGQKHRRTVGPKPPNAWTKQAKAAQVEGQPRFSAAARLPASLRGALCTKSFSSASRAVMWGALTSGLGTPGPQ